LYQGDSKHRFSSRTRAKTQGQKESFGSDLTPHQKPFAELFTREVFSSVAKMFSLEFLEAQLQATPFVPFTLVSNSGDRFNIKTADHADLPPPDEQTGERPPWFIAYTERSIPRYLAVVNIASLEHNQP